MRGFTSGRKEKHKRKAEAERNENLQVLKRMTARRQAYSVASTFICLNLATVSWNVLISLSRPSWRSALTAKTLKDMGMTNVVQFADGFKAWKEAGGPVAEKAVKDA